MPKTKLLNTLPRLSRLTIAALALTLAVAPVLAQFGRPPQSRLRLGLKRPGSGVI